jgi:hypothetical protein
MMRKLVTFVAVLSLAFAMLATQSVPANATTVVGRINGGGTSVMTDLPAGMGVTSFGFEATLFSDGSARGHFTCVDQMGDFPGYPGNIFGAITSWSQRDGIVSLHVTDAKLVVFGSGLVVSGGLPFTVTIQTFGGPGVGHWTLDVPGFPSRFNGGPICQELMTSGQVVVRWN